MLIETGALASAVNLEFDLEFKADCNLRTLPFEELVPKALRIINGLRVGLLGLEPLEELPRDCKRHSWKDCLVGRCFGEVPYLAEVTCAADPYVGELERRFEARELPEYEAPVVHEPCTILSWL